MTTTTELASAARELDELIATETVRARHVALVRVRSLIERALALLDNVITSETDHSP